MKTFETEMHNIPEGATHYSDEAECDCFAWYKVLHDVPFIWCVGYEEWWVKMIHPFEFKNEEVKPIPQNKEVEWDGEYQLEGGSEWFKYKSTYVASNGDMFAMCLVPNANKGQPFEQYLDVETTKFRKPETPEQKLEREELEAAYSLYCKCGIQYKTVGFDEWKDCYTDPWLSIVRETNYKVKGE